MALHQQMWGKEPYSLIYHNKINETRALIFCIMFFTTKTDQKKNTLMWYKTVIFVAINASNSIPAFPMKSATGGPDVWHYEQRISRQFMVPWDAKKAYLKSKCVSFAEERLLKDRFENEAESASDRKLQAFLKSPGYCSTIDTATYSVLDAGWKSSFSSDK